MVIKAEFPNDVRTIYDILLSYGYFTTTRTIIKFWRWYSDERDSGWLTLDGRTGEQIKDVFEVWAYKFDKVEWL